jgi:hypothetical protein
MIGHHALIGATSRVAGAASWTPADLGAALLTRNPHTNLPASGAVTTWSDDGSGIATATPTGGITAGAEANGLRYAEFNGTSQWFTFVGNPAGSPADTIDLRGVCVAGLIWIDYQTLLGGGVYAGSAFGSSNNLNFDGNAGTPDGVSLLFRHTSSATPANVQFRHAQLQSSPFGAVWESATEVIPARQWVSYAMLIPESGNAELMINSRANVVGSQAIANATRMPIRMLGARWLSTSGAPDLPFKGRKSEFFGFAAEAADSSTLDNVFAYLNAMKPA